jgi:hypothetical protein
MSTTRTQRLVSLGLAIALAAAPLTTAAQAPSPPAAGAPGAQAEGVWPRQIEANGAVVLIYQPQIDSWQGNRLSARSAVAVRPPNSQSASFGVVWITARTAVDKERGVVLLDDIQIPKVSFPTMPAATQQAYLAAARKHVPSAVQTVPLQEFEANLAAGQASASTAVPVVNTPPRIIVTATPALLVRIDGQPSLRQTQGSPLMRVINTRALIVLDPATGRYWLAVGNRWFAASQIDGPWALAPDGSSALDAARQAAVASQQVDLLDGAASAGGPPPAIYVSSVPTELIETTGPPTWSPITGTELLYATNTKAHMFLELKSQATYVLISGRWFRAPSTSGPWEYVPGPQLPPDFAKIPETGPNGVVLAAVPGTPQAQEAVIANSIPQTATVERSQATFTATYDGAPQWYSITGTPLTYAANSPTPVIRVDAKTYYALYNAVWFVATTPAGPWAVAATVPTVIYTIPVASPLHYVTYVRVYGATPSVVYVGYTPGYLGTVVAPDGVVVYGTGVVYTPWVGTVWYPPPPTYGAGAGFAWGAATGFVMGAAVGAATSAAVWGCCGSTANINVNKTYNYNYNNGNVYNNWSKTTVSNGDKSATVYQTPNTRVATNNQNNNVYASHDGNVYRNDNGTWQKWDGGGNGWQDTQRQPSSTSQTQTTSASRSSTTSTQTSPSTSTSQSATREQRQGQTSTGQGGQSSPSTSTSQSGTGQQRAEQRQGQTSSGQLGSTQQAQRPQSGTTQGAEGQRAQSWGQGAGAQGEGASRSQSGSFGQRFSGASGQGWQDRESAARDRGFERMGGGRAGGFGGFRR